MPNEVSIITNEWIKEALPLQNPLISNNGHLKRTVSCYTMVSYESI